MDPELKKALEELRGLMEGSAKRNADVEAKVVALETMARGGEATIKELRGEIETLKKAIVERDQRINDLAQTQRRVALAGDPVRDRTQALALYGMMVREMYCRHKGVAMPARFAAEADQVRAYREQRATIEESTGVGAYFIPTVLAQDILDTLEEVSEILGEIDMAMGMPTKGTMPTLTTRPSLKPKRASSDTKFTQSDFGFSYLSWDTEEAYLYFPVDNWVLELSPIALGQRLVPLTREAFLDGLAKWLILADGTATYNSDTGILNEATYVTDMGSGHTSFGSVDNTDLMKVLKAMLKRGRGQRCRWVMSLYVLGILEDLSREGKTKIINEDGEQTLCKRRPVIIDEDFPDETDDGKSKIMLGVGDLAAWWLVIAGNGIQIASSTEYLFGNNQTAIRATAHIDVVRKPVNTFRLLKTAAA